MSIERAQALDLPYAVLLSAAESQNAYYEDDVQLRGGWAEYRDRLYDRAGVGPEDIDFLETYDDYPVIVMQQFEDLGFCAKGGGRTFRA